MIEFEKLPDLCPVCGVHGDQPCIADDGRSEVPDHEGRPIDHVNREEE